jgi:hypothetical protein
METSLKGLWKNNKKVIVIFVFILLILSIGIPFIVNYLTFFRVLPIKGSEETWISTLGSFWGAIVGGMISGILTLFGVILTLNGTLTMLRKEKNLDYYKERLRYFYQPAYIKVEKFEYYTKNVLSKKDLNFNSLDIPNRNSFLALLRNSSSYASDILVEEFFKFEGLYNDWNRSVIGSSYEGILKNEMNKKFRYICKQIKDEFKDIKIEISGKNI